MNNPSPRAWDVNYEWKAVVLLCLGFAVVGIDRFLVIPLFPSIQQEFSLTQQDLGLITGALSVTWGLAAIFLGGLSDRLGRRKIIISALVIFSLLASVSGFATGLTSLVIIRMVIGFFEGAYTAPAITATIEASKPSRQGMNVGLQQMGLPLFGLGIAPIVVTQLLHYMDWRWTFVIMAAPGLIVAFLLYRILREPNLATRAVHSATHDVKPHAWRELFRHRNILLAMAIMLACMMSVNIYTAHFPSYLVGLRGFTPQEMGFVLSAQGFGAAAGTFLMPALSDRIGRKPIMLIGLVVGMLGQAMLMVTPHDPAAMFVWMFAAWFCIFTVITTTIGPLSAESVPAALMASASGVVIGVGEIFGGGIAPVVAGVVADRFGLQYIIHLGILGLALAFVVTLGLKETAPAVLERRARKGAMPATPPA